MSKCVTGIAIAALLSGGAVARAAAAPDAAAIYKRQCAGCHGADGSGNTSAGKAFKLRDLRSSEVQNLTDEQLFDILNKGKGKMPAYANQGHDNLHALVQHIRQMGKGSSKGGDGAKSKK